jgi:hypothetical protein
MAKFTISSHPLCDNQVEQANNLLSTLSIIGARSSIFGLVVPMGKPRYVKGTDPISHQKVFARRTIFSGGTLIGYIWDFP